MTTTLTKPERTLLQKLASGWKLQGRTSSPNYVCVAPDRWSHANIPCHVVHALRPEYIGYDNKITDVGRAALKAVAS